MPQPVFLAPRKTTPTLVPPSAPSYAAEPITISFKDPALKPKTSINLPAALAFGFGLSTLLLLVAFGYFMLQPLTPIAGTAITPPPVQKNNDTQPLAAFVPLPQAALNKNEITGRDFYEGRAGAKPPVEKIELLPMLEKLPVGNALAREQARPKSRASNIIIEVEDSTSNLREAANRAALSGKKSRAEKLYAKAVGNNPNDETARHNLVSLLLDKAALLDEEGKTKEAIAAYQRALKLWGEDDDTAATIRARLNYLKHQK